jgi:hypothetical protein
VNDQNRKRNLDRFQEEGKEIERKDCLKGLKVSERFSIKRNVIVGEMIGFCFDKDICGG